IGAVPASTLAAPPPVAPSSAAPAAVAALPDGAVIAQVLLDWAAAWSAQDADKYLSFYAPDFTPEGGASRAAWEAQRRERIARPRQIRVQVSDLKVVPQGPGRVQATFKQDYRSDTLSNQSTKVLEMSQAQGQWRIRRESAR
ncbi:MAG: YybH family protein, partial [Nevskiaceae bacterium]